VLLLEQLLRLAGVQGVWVPLEQLMQLLVGEVPAQDGTDVCAVQYSLSFQCSLQCSS
jgi:hypothetical protein